MKRASDSFCCTILSMVSDNSIIQQHMPLRGSRVTPLANGLCSFFSYDGLRNELLSIWQHAPSTIALCDADCWQLFLSSSPSRFCAAKSHQYLLL